MKRNFFQMLGAAGSNSDNPFEMLDGELKNFISEIIILRHIRDEQLQTITELRSEIFRLKKQLAGNGKQ